MEMTGPWKAWKSKPSFSTLSTAPWKSRKTGEISTFPQPGRRVRGKVENQNQVFHFPTAARDDDSCSLSPKTKTKTKTKNLRKDVGRFAASVSHFFRITLYWKRSLVSGSFLD